MISIAGIPLKVTVSSLMHISKNKRFYASGGERMAYIPLSYGFEQLFGDALYFLGIFIIVATIVCIISGFICSFFYDAGVYV